MLIPATLTLPTIDVRKLVVSVEDVWHDNYGGAPMDGSAWYRGGDDSRRVVRGGSWNNNPQNLRSANRNRNTTDNRNNNLGFRVGSTLFARAGAITVAPGEH